ncbi:retrovirus-related pol polyprotein from transposon TNT 1-94 [Tanacetum coccineum]
MGNPGLFTLPCRLRDSKPFNTLADLGSCINIIPLYLFKKLNIGLLEEIDHIFGLADRTKSYLVGIVKDVEVHIGKLKLLNDFYVLNMKRDPKTPLLVGRRFLSTAKAVIDCRMAKIAMGEGITRSAQNPFTTARMRFLDCHLPGECEISRDAELNPFKDTLVFRRMKGLHKGYDRFQSFESIRVHRAGVSTKDANIRNSLDLYPLPGLFFENDVKGSTASSSSTQNVAFVSKNTSSTNNVCTAFSVSNPSGQNSQCEQTSSYSLLVNQSSCPQLDHEDLEQLDEYDLEEMDLKWQVAMISMRMKKFYKKTGRKLQFDVNEPTMVDGSRTGKKEDSKALVTIDGEGVDWTNHLEEDEDYALMACNSSESDTEREQLSDASIEIKAYSQGLKKVEAQLVAHQQGYGDYQLGNVTISRVYYSEGLGHNLFSVGQFCDADLEVVFQKNTCFIRNLEGVNLLSGSRDTNLYIISLDDMLTTSLICLLSKASNTKSWLKFHKDHLCSVCALGKCKKSSHQPKAEDTNQEKLYLLHMDLCGPIRVASINGKSSGLVPNPIPQQPFIPPPRYDWDRLFQLMFDEYFIPPSITISPV